MRIHRLPFCAGLAAGALFLSSRGSAQQIQSVRAATTLYLYNGVADMLAGDMWDVTTRDFVLRDLQGGPLAWPVVGLGTTSAAFHNGEVVAAGTGAQPRLLWARPEYPGSVEEITTQRLPFLALTRCNPETEIKGAAAAGQPIHAQVAQLAASRNVQLAAVQVTGTFKDTTATVAYHLRKEGTPLRDPNIDTSIYQLPVKEAATRAWTLCGYYAATADTQVLVSGVGAPVHLHGVRSDLDRGGHLGAGTVVNATIQIFPIVRVVAKQADLTVSGLRIEGTRARFTVTNGGENAVSYVSVIGTAGGQRVFRILLSDLAPGASRPVVLTPDWADAGRSLTVQVDPENDVRESDEGNNTTGA